VLRDERLSSVNSSWRLKPHLTVLNVLALLVQKVQILTKKALLQDYAGELLKCSARVVLEHVASGFCLSDAGGHAVLSCVMHAPQVSFPLFY
jgi:ABC-type arginine transport system ATPase subunit